MKRKRLKEQMLIAQAVKALDDYQKSQKKKDLQSMLRSFRHLISSFEKTTLGYAAEVHKEASARIELERFQNYLPALLGYWDKNLINVYSNQAYAEYFGKKPEQIKGGSFKKLLGPEIYKKNLPYAKMALAGKPQIFERSIPTPSGKIRHTLAQYVPDKVNGKVQGFFVIVSDISSVKELEEKNREIEAKLTSNSKMSALGEMAAAIAHEVNNPLAIIFGHACQINRNLSKSKVNLDQVKASAQEIEMTSRRIEKIIDGLRIISRDSSLEQLEPHPLVDIIEQTLILCSGRMKSLNIRFEFLKSSSLIFAICRPIQISQIILNLLNNAIEAAEESTNRWIKLKLTSNKKEAVIEISNSGPKVSKEISHKIFEPFFTTKQKKNGTGLGLSVSRDLAQVNQGRVELIPHAKNTQFRLVLKKG